MKAYVQLTSKGKECLGSFNVCILDARESLGKQIADGHTLLERERRPDGFRIVRSERFIDTDEDKSKVSYTYLNGV